MGVSERRACRVVGQNRSTQRHRTLAPQDEPSLVTRTLQLAGEYGRYGYRRITALLRREGWRVNHKRVERIWRQEGLKVPKKQRHCQVDEQFVDRPPRCWAPTRREPAMLGIKNVPQLQLDNTLASGVPDRGGPRSPMRGGFKAGIHGPTSSSSNPAHSSREMGIPPVIHGGRPGPVRRGSHTRENHGTTPARLSHRTPKVVFYRRRQHPPLALVGWSACRDWNTTVRLCGRLAQNTARPSPALRLQRTSTTRLSSWCVTVRLTETLRLSMRYRPA